MSPLSVEINAEIENKYENLGISLDKKFESVLCYNEFVDKFMKISYSEKKKGELEKIKEKIAALLPDNTLLFDMGYSGNLQKIINNITNKRVDCLYIHSDGHKSFDVEKRIGFKIYEVYDFTPKITSIIRETFISDTSPACIGYAIKDNELSYLFDDEVYRYTETFAIKSFQRGAVDFCKSFIEIFKEYISGMKVRCAEASLPLEFFFTNSKEFDRYVFVNTYAEDNVHSNYKRTNLFDIWQWHTSQIKRNFMPSCNGEKQKCDSSNVANSSLKKVIVSFMDRLKIFLKG